MTARAHELIWRRQCLRGASTVYAPVPLMSAGAWRVFWLALNALLIVTAFDVSIRATPFAHAADTWIARVMP